VAKLGAMGGWDQVRARLIGNAMGQPLIFFFNVCRDGIRTLPALQHDLDKPEDVDTNSEDHAPDEIRYACMSRPWVHDLERKTEFKTLNECTLDDLWEIQDKKRKQYA
jgi:hypothetical protein